MTSDVITVCAILVGAFVLLRVAERQMGHRVGEPEISTYEAKIKRLSQEIGDQKAQYEQQIGELNRRIDFLIDQLLRAGLQIRELETRKDGSYPVPSVPVVKRLPEKPLLLICGTEQSFCEADRQALRRTGINFQRLMATTKAGVISELRRRRQDDKLFPWIHVTAHATSDGILLSDGIAEPDWWNEQLSGVEVVFLAACQSSAVADALAGMVTVVFVLEDIENKNASDFTYAFWRRMDEHRDAIKAYRQAVIEVPQVREYTDIRMN